VCTRLEFVGQHLGQWPGPLVAEDNGQVTKGLELYNGLGYAATFDCMLHGVMHAIIQVVGVHEGY
jgi:hypothetical protein